MHAHVIISFFLFDRTVQYFVGNAIDYDNNVWYYSNSNDLTRSALSVDFYYKSNRSTTRRKRYLSFFIHCGYSPALGNEPKAATIIIGHHARTSGATTVCNCEFVLILCRL